MTAAIAALAILESACLASARVNVAAVALARLDARQAWSMSPRRR